MKPYVQRPPDIRMTCPNCLASKFIVVKETRHEQYTGIADILSAGNRRNGENQMIALGKDGNGRSVTFNLQTLLQTRLLISAVSGAGKSWTIRRILEQSFKRVQHIVFDWEGGFVTLREKYDYLIVGEDGDIPISPKTATKLAGKLMRHRISAILDMSDMSSEDRKPFTRLFLEGMMSTPKKHREPAFIVIDEADKFAPQIKSDDCGIAVADIISRGRKYDWAAILATQRLAKLNKDACADLLNIMIGNTNMDIDQRRAADYLGLSGKVDRIALRKLPRGSFHCFGPAIQAKQLNDFGIVDVQIGPVKTSHEKRSRRKDFTVPEPKGGLKKALSGLREELEPKPVKKPSVTTPGTDKPGPKMQELLNEIAQLKLQVTLAWPYKEKYALVSRSQMEQSRALRDLKVIVIERWKLFHKNEAEAQKTFNAMQSALSEIEKDISNFKLEPPPDVKGLKPTEVILDDIPHFTPEYDNEPLNKKAGAMALLDAIRLFENLGRTSVERAAVAVLCGMSPRSSTVRAHLASLKKSGLINSAEGRVSLTDAGRAETSAEMTLMDLQGLHNKWFEICKNGERKYLKKLVEIFPEQIEKSFLAGLCGDSPKSSTVRARFSKLKRYGAIEYPSSGTVKASSLLFPEELR